MNTKLKQAAMRKAKEEGWNFSAMLNFAAKAYVSNRLSMEMIDPKLAKGLDDIAKGRTTSLEQVIRKLQAGGK